MIKNLLAVVAIALLLVSCGNNANEEKPVFTVEQALAQIQDLVDSSITIEGTVVHVCKEGGGKMFLVGEDQDSKIKIEASDEVTMFEVELEGSDVIVQGVVVELRIDEAYLLEWEAEIKAEIAADTLKADTLNEVAADAVVEETVAEEAEEEHVHDAELHHGDPFEKIKELRKELEASEKGYLSFYSIKCTKVTVKEVEAEEAEAK